MKRSANGPKQLLDHYQAAGQELTSPIQLLERDRTARQGRQ